jgi:asparagine synthase (glutamine-hydrolysing)
MSAFCGWLGFGKDDVPPAQVLAAMADAFRGRRLQEASIVSPAGAVWATAAQTEGVIYDAEEPWIAILGSPRWRDASLAEEQRARGSAAALRRAYRQHGLDLFSRLAGAFAFAILDPSTRKGLIAVDRMGIHRLCFSSHGDRFIFGSTADLVRAHPEVGATIPFQSIYNYFHAYVCRSPGSIYADQRKLGPAQYLVWDNGHVRVASYWRTPFDPDRTRSAEDLAEELVAQVRRAVRQSLPDGRSEGVGAFLSGGLDSSTVAGMLNEVTGCPAEAFTIGFGETSYNEMQYAEAASRKFGLRSHQHYLTPEDVVTMVPKIAAYYDEPFGNSSAVPAYFCAAMARDEGLMCLLAGDGGDEILAGNSRYLDQQGYMRYGQLPVALRAAVKFAASHTPLLCNTPLWRRAQRYIARAELPLPMRLEVYNFCQIERMVEVFDADALRQIDLDAPWREMRETYEGAASTDPLQRMMHLDLKQALADADLRKVEGMSELAGIDVRFPFLDDDLVAFCATIPPELHVKGGRLRAFFKDAFKDFLPPEVIAKKKHGFGMPTREWTRDHPALRELAYDSLRSLSGRRLVRDAFIGKVMTEHARAEPTIYDGLVWDLMMLELWLQTHEPTGH